MPFPSGVRGTVGTSKGFCGRGSVVFSGDAGRGTDIWSCWFSFAVCTSKINICAASFFFQRGESIVAALRRDGVGSSHTRIWKQMHIKAAPSNVQGFSTFVRGSATNTLKRQKGSSVDMLSLFSIWCSYCWTFCFKIWISCLCPCAAHMRGCLATNWIWLLNPPFIQKAPFTCQK